MTIFHEEALKALVVAPDNVSDILAKTGAHKIHASCRVCFPSKTSAKQRVFGFGKNIKEATVENIHALIKAIAQK